MIKKFLNENFRLILYFCLNVTSLVIHLYATQTLTAKLTVSEYGVYSLVLSIASLISLLGIGWTASSIVYVGLIEYKNTNTFRKTLSARAIIIGFTSTLVITFLLVFRKKLMHYLSIDATLILIMYYLLSFFTTTITNYLLAIKKQLPLTILEILGSLVLVILLLTKSITVYKALIFNIIGQSTLLLGVFLFKKEDISKFEYNQDYFKKVLSFSLAQLLGFLGGYLINYGGNIIINFYLTKEDLGIFNLAFRLFSNISSLILLVNTYYASFVVNIITEKKRTSIYQFYFHLRPFLIIVFLLGTILSFLFGPTIILFIFKEKYQLAIKPFLVLILANLPLSLEVFYISVYNTLNKHVVLQIVTIGQAAVSLGLMIILIPQKGIMGAVSAIAISYYAKTIFSYLYLEPKILKLLTP